MTNPAPADLLIELSFGFLPARALHVIAELGVADVLADGPATAEEIARRTSTAPDALDRMLRLLETHGIFAGDGEGNWSLTEASELLRSDHSRSMRSFIRMIGSPITWGSFTALAHTARTGEAGAVTIHPGGFFAHLQDHPDEHAVFDEAMTGKAHGDIAAILAVQDFAQYRHVIDVGGGRGHLATAIIETTTDTDATVFDLPVVTARLTPRPRFGVATGDFFRDALPAGDAYVLMHITHDWDDKAAAAILTAVAHAARPTRAPILLIEMLIPEGPEPHPAKAVDVMMLATTGGRERTLAGYEALLELAGLELITTKTTATAMAVLEARVAPRVARPCTA